MKMLSKAFMTCTLVGWAERLYLEQKAVSASVKQQCIPPDEGYLPEGTRRPWTGKAIRLLPRVVDGDRGLAYWRGQGT